MSWKDLSIKEKADLMKIYVYNGITKLDDIISHYNSYATGGELDNPTDEDPIYKAQPLKPVKISAKRNTIADIQRKRRLLSVEPSKEVILNTNLNKANEFYTSDVVPRLLREHEGLKTKPETSFPEMWKGSIKFDPNIREEAAAYASPFNIVSKTEPRYSRRKPLDEDFIKNMVHENTHVWQYELPTRDREYKKTSKQLLNDAYIPTGGLKNMYGPLAPLHKHTEQEAVNREIRYKFWSELKNKLGRTPTIDELDDYINKSTDINVLLKFNNGYFKPNTPNTDDYKKTHDAVEKIKQALIHVADNNTPTEANYAANGGYLGHITPFGHLFQDGGYTEKEDSSFISELDWSPESWFSKRVAKPDGTYYNADEAARLASHVPEYYNIEQTSKQNGTWLKMDDGSTWEGDPRAWVMMQSQAYRRNYSPKPWYTGQAEWPTQFDYPKDKKGAVNTNKVTRAPYYNGQMWFSNDKTYGDAFSYYYASTGEGIRQSIPEEANVSGHTFLSAIPKKGIYRKLAAPKPGTADMWDSMPYFLQNGHIYREKPSNISTTQGFRYTHNTRKDGKKVLTDDIVNWSRDLGDQGIFLHQVDDGQGIKFSGDVIDILKRYSEGKNAKKRVKKSEFQLTYPILEEFISQPGFTDKVKFIEGNTGDFDINNPYKYAENVLDNDSSQDTVHYAALGGKLGKVTPYGQWQYPGEVTTIPNNTFQAGGYVNKKDPVLKDREPQANFYQRLLNPNRQTIPDWQHKGNIATHKMSYVTNEDNTKAVVYPEVQEINGKLYDFTDPRNKEGKWAAYDRAVQTGDTIQMTPEQANFWTQHYKEFYPSFNYATGGHLYQTGGPDDDEPPKPKFKQSQEQYYDRNNDIIYAQDSIGEGYQHEYFHARPNTALLNNLRPYYENLNDNRLIELGADLPFVKRVENDPNYFYSPEEIGARVSAARYMLEKAGVKNIDAEFLKNARLNELKYGDNFRDLLHMYNDENLLNIFNGQYQKGGSLGHITNLGQWKYPGEVTTIPSNNITMKGVDYPVIGVSNTGDTKYMLPNMDYLFDGNYVTEYPLHKFQKVIKNF